jgi:hypothetical protein
MALDRILHGNKPVRSEEEVRVERETWRKTYDGIWPMYLRKLPGGGQIIVTQYGHRDWRWSVFPCMSGIHKSATGTAANGTDAKRDALAAAL